MANPAVEMPVSQNLEFRVNGDIPHEHFGMLASIINESWGWLIEATPEIVAQRVKSGFPIIVAYDERKPDDKIPGTDILPEGKIPVVVLEAMPAVTKGDLDRIPRTYAELTNNGTWMNGHIHGYDTMIFVDLTAIESRRGKKGNGEVVNAVHFARSLLEGKHSHGFQFDPKVIKHVGTYSPAVDGVIHMHERLGALNSNYRIPGARDPSRNRLRSVDGQICTDDRLKDTNINVYHGFGMLFN